MTDQDQEGANQPQCIEIVALSMVHAIFLNKYPLRIETDLTSMPALADGSNGASRRGLHSYHALTLSQLVGLLA